jgi:hypothetical protein
VRRGRVRRIVAGVLRAAGRCAIRSLMSMSTWSVDMPEADSANAGRRGDVVEPRPLSAAERQAWADLEQRLR